MPYFYLLPGRLYYLKGFFFLVIFLSGFFCADAQTRYYVDQSVAASGDGLSWTTAYKSLKVAITNASTTVADEIWVKAGTHIPYDGAPAGYERLQTFLIEKPIKIYGGFAGTETLLSQRDWEVNETILSGNIGDAADSTDNIYHVVLIVGQEAQVLEGVVLDGFTIRDGYANITGSYTYNGNTIFNYRCGGIYNIYASPMLKNLKIYKNVGFTGGGLQNESSNPVIDNCNILANYSGANGGGMQNLDAMVTILNSVIDSNIVNNETGGGIDNSGIVELTIKNSTIKNNKARNGGGIATKSHTISLENVIIEKNVATNYGGGIFNSNSARMSMKHTTISENKAIYGAGINTTRSVIIIDSSDILKNESTYYGGGIASDRDSVVISYTNINENKNVDNMSGGGIYSTGMEIHVSNSKFERNVGKIDGGALYFKSNSHGTFTDVDFVQNQSLSYGGAIRISDVTGSTTNFIFTGGTFSKNRARWGGAVIVNAGTHVFSGVTISANTSSSSGGGIVLEKGSGATITDCVFSNNEFIALTVNEGVNPTLERVKFYNNLGGSGGGLYISKSGGAFNALEFRGNTGSYGAGIYISQGTPVITNSLFSGNYASSQGGGIYVSQSTVSFTNLTFAGNRSGQGAGIYFNNSENCAVRNSIVYGNSSGIYAYNGAPSVMHSLVQGMSDETNGNIDGSTDPLFIEMVNPTTAPFITGDYRLDESSPVIGNGSTSYYEPGATPDISTVTHDLDGNVRTESSVIGMGAYAYPASVVPLKLVAFDVVQQNKQAQLSWQTMNEVNVSHFEIQRSSDGQAFTVVGKVNADGKGVYHFTDAYPLPAKSFYRLKMIDIDGYTEYSHVKVFSLADKLIAALSIYPNPAKDKIRVVDGNNAPVKGIFRIVDASGRVVLNTQVNPLNVQQLRPDIYYLTVIGEDGKVSGKQSFLKQ